MGEETSLMDDLASAWDAAEAEDEQPEETQEPVAEEPVAEVEAQPEEEPPAEEPTEEPPEPEAAASEEPPAEAPDQPPSDLGAAAREAWKDTPEAVKAEFARVSERLENMGVKYGEDAKRARDMDQALAPYQQYLAMNGGPGQVIPGLLQTGTLLQHGSPQQKAQAAANIIKQFGIDINTLDNLLVGNQTQQNSTQATVEQMVEQRFQQEQQRRAQQEQQQAQKHIQDEVQQFATDPKNEFYKDVSTLMGRLMDVAAREQRQLSLADAYKEACQIDPTVRSILIAREAQNNVTQKRQAAASISGGPSGHGAPSEPGTIREAIEAAMSNTGRL